MLTIAAAVDIGVSRAKNDDRALLGGQILAQGAHALACESDEALIAVSDGVGGYAGGDLCSQLTLETLCAQPFPRGVQAAREAAAAANSAVLRQRRMQPAYAQMAATLVFAAVFGDQLLLCNLGDSRAYRLRRGRLARLTADHTLANELSACYGAPQADDQRRDGVITRYIGMEEGFDPDISDDVGGLYQGDTLLLCSDGLYGAADDEQLLDALLREGDLPALAHRLIDLAKAAGSTDNISAVLLRKE